MIKTNKLSIIPILILLVAILGSCGTQSIKDQIKNTKAIDEYDQNATIKDVKTVKFGKFKSGRNLEWIIVKKNDSEAVLLLNNSPAENMVYAENTSQIGYKQSSLYKYLIETMEQYYFTEEEAKFIVNYEDLKGLYVFKMIDYVNYFNSNKKLAEFIYDPIVGDNVKSWHLSDYIPGGYSYYVDSEGEVQKREIKNLKKPTPDYEKWSGKMREVFKQVYELAKLQYSLDVVGATSAVRPAIKISFD